MATMAALKGVEAMAELAALVVVVVTVGLD